MALFPPDLYGQIALLLILAVGLAALALVLRLPSILAYLACGILLGPATIDLEAIEEPVELFAHLGISLLLLVVGLRLDVHLLRSLGLPLLWGALLQILITTLLGGELGWLLGFRGVELLYLGLALAFSSTVLVVKLLSDRREIDSLYGRMAVGILLVQDLTVVVALLLLALLSGNDRPFRELLWLPLRGATFLLGVAFTGRYLLRPLLGYLAQSRELLMLAALAWGLGLGSLSHGIGFSHELGAFLGGVVLAATPYHEALSSRLVSLRDFLLPFFFVQLGSYLELEFLGKVWREALLFALTALILKPLLTTVLLKRLGFSLYNAGLAGLTLGQISEFSLILAFTGLAYGHLTTETVALLTLSAFLTMALSSFLIADLHAVFHTLLPLLRRLSGREVSSCEVPNEARENPPEVIVIGLGRYGLRLATRLKSFGFEVLGIDFDPSRVREGTRRGLRAYYLDAEDLEALEHLPLKQVRWVVSTIRHLTVTKIVVQALKAVGYCGKIATVTYREEDRPRLARLGVDLILMAYLDAADYAAELIRQQDR